MICDCSQFWFRLFIGLCLVGFSGCASVNKKNINPLNMFNTYESALRDYQQGKVLEAREIVLKIDSENESYDKARTLLRKQIEPARLRLLRHYKRKARAAESGKAWADAKRLYQQAALFSLGNSALEKKVGRMELHMQQLRLDKLISQRRKEDATFMKWLDAYEIPLGLDPDDEPFERRSRHFQNELDARAQTAYIEARRYLSRGYPEVAYVDIESHLRFRPESKMGKKLLKNIRKTLPRGLRLPASVTFKKSRKIPLRVKAADIDALMRKGSWLTAHKYAIAYRRSGGKDADAYLKRVEVGRKKSALKSFERGKLAFQQEKMDKAVRYLKRAVDLDPDNAEYTENLQRASQLKERLYILRQEATQ